MQKGPPMGQISLAAWTRTPVGIKGFAWRILQSGPDDSFRMTGNPAVDAVRIGRITFSYSGVRARKVNLLGSQYNAAKLWLSLKDTELL